MKNTHNFRIKGDKGRADRLEGRGGGGGDEGIQREGLACGGEAGGYLRP